MSITTSLPESLVELVASLDPSQGVWIDGRGLPASHGALFTVEDPASGADICNVANGSVTEARAAVDAAHRAFPAWAATSARTRSEVLRRAFELMIADADRLAALISWENGKALSDA